MFPPCAPFLNERGNAYALPRAPSCFSSSSIFYKNGGRNERRTAQSAHGEKTPCTPLNSRENFRFPAPFPLVLVQGPLPTFRFAKNGGRNGRRTAQSAHGEKTPCTPLNSRENFRFPAPFPLVLVQGPLPTFRFAKNGGRNWTRTSDPFHVKEVL